MINCKVSEGEPVNLKSLNTSSSIVNQMYLIILIFLLWWGSSSITPFLPLIAKAIHLTLLQSSIFFGIMGITRLISQPVLGYILAIVNEKNVIKLTFLMLFVSSLSYLLTNNFYIYVFARILEGLALATFSIAVRIIINSNFNQPEINKINNYYSGAQNLGNFIGPALAGFVITITNIKSIFVITCIIYFVANILVNKFRTSFGSFATKNENYTYKQYFKIIDIRLIIILLVHSLEFVGLGLWLSGWAAYASIDLHWNPAMIGMSFSILAVSSIIIVPFLNYFLIEKLRVKIIIGLLLLSIQPLLVILLTQQHVLMWFSFIVGGIGATVYFSVIHSYIAKFLHKQFTAIFYGFVGSFTFTGQSIGQLLTPYLWYKFSYRAPIILDFIVLLVTIISYLLLFTYDKFYLTEKS